MLDICFFFIAGDLYEKLLKEVNWGVDEYNLANYDFNLFAYRENEQLF